MKVNYVNIPNQLLPLLAGGATLTPEQAQWHNSQSSHIFNSGSYQVNTSIAHRDHYDWSYMQDVIDIGRQRGMVLDYSNSIIPIHSHYQLAEAQGIMRDIIMRTPEIQAYRHHHFLDGWNGTYEYTPKPIELSQDQLYLEIVNGVYHEDLPNVTHYYPVDSYHRQFNHSEKGDVIQAWSLVKEALAMNLDPTAIDIELTI